eukprot:TRINITY_DN7284_c0_g1_i1.p1 TRINITY_DN7284_c0_g1~~TRINITY_DN7284_c0_g1_i1.p1  ORF type:complete len:715 (+),score=210.31 TRINITY_DN7284_c0_g1_i1:53-2197(+)
MIRANGSMDAKKEAKRLKAEEKKRLKEQKAAEKRAAKERKAQEKREAKLKKKGLPLDADKPPASDISAASDAASSSAPPSSAPTETVVQDPEASTPPAQVDNNSANANDNETTNAKETETSEHAETTPAEESVVPAVAVEGPSSPSQKPEEPAKDQQPQETEQAATDAAAASAETIAEPEGAAADAGDIAQEAQTEAAIPSQGQVEEKQSRDSLPVVPPRVFDRSASVASSIRGAPAQLPSHVTHAGPPAPTRSEETDEAPPEVEMVEDEADDRVGQMNGSDAVETSTYLKQAVEYLREQMLELWDNGDNTGYHYHYQDMASIGRDQSFEASMEEPNRLKNRYGNIVAYDAHRVKLPLRDDDPFSDYINASWVDGYGKPNGYIASQGPVPNSFVDFWRMAWEFKISSIVMVTHEVEKGRMKCHRYWPDPTSSPPTQHLNYGDISVLHVSTVPHRHFVVRTFLVSKDGEERTIKQFAYTSWPDHGVPLTTAELLGFRNAVNESTPSKDAPILIHCSAGVGRTGTYIAIDSLVKQCLDMGGMPDVDKIIHELRMRRNYMVQTEMQYIFIYRAVFDCLSELLKEESAKAGGLSTMDKEAQRELQQAAEEAAKAKMAEEEREQKAIAEARQALEKEALAREETSAANAKAVVSMSLGERMQLLDEAEARWLANYQLSLAEWNERNKFEAEEYDTSSELTPVQSRLEALKQKGLLDVKQ